KRTYGNRASGASPAALSNSPSLALTIARTALYAIRPGHGATNARPAESGSGRREFESRGDAWRIRNCDRPVPRDRGRSEFRSEFRRTGNWPEEKRFICGKTGPHRRSWRYERKPIQSENLFVPEFSEGVTVRSSTRAYSATSASPSPALPV